MTLICWLLLIWSQSGKQEFLDIREDSVWLGLRIVISDNMAVPI